MSGRLLMPIENNKDLYKDLLLKIKGSVYLSETMSKHTTFRIGGKADLLVLPSNSEDLYLIYQFAKTHGVPVYLIGSGSNLLISDSGFHGIIIKIQSNLNRIECEDNHLIAQAGVLSQKIIQEALHHHLVGLDFLSGIPGTVGGCTYMNAGMNLHSISEVIVSAEVFNTNSMEEEIYAKDEFHFAYRNSILQTNHFVVLSVKLKLSEGNIEEEKERIRIWKEKRSITQPLQYSNAGCIWKNPENRPAGKLIEEASLKGFQIGDAQISNLHGNFIINKNKATAKNVLDLMNHAEEEIYQKFGILLEREIQIIGDY